MPDGTQRWSTMAMRRITRWKNPRSENPWFRRRVPAEVVAFMGRREIKFSLGTSDPTLAQIRCMEENVKARADVARACSRQDLHQAEPTAARRHGGRILPRDGGGAPRQSRRSGRLGSGNEAGCEAQEATHDASAPRHPLPLHVREGSRRIPERAERRPFGLNLLRIDGHL
jgi:hypothetical protein